MSRVMGIDLSLVETGIVCLEHGILIRDHLITSKLSKDELEIERIKKIAREVIKCIECDKPELIVIEGLSYGSKNTTSLCQLAKLNFSVEIYCYQTGYKYLMVAPGHLKKFITGTGIAKKELMLLQVYKKYGVEFNNNNLCDAYALCRLGEDHLKNEPKKT